MHFHDEQVISETAIKQLRCAFMEAFDENGDNKIDIGEVGTCLFHADMKLDM